MRIDVDNYTLAALVAADHSQYDPEPKLPTVAAERARVLALLAIKSGDGEWTTDPESRTARIERLLDAHDRAQASRPPRPRWRRALSLGLEVVLLATAMVAAGRLLATVFADEYGPVTITNAGGREVSCHVPAMTDDEITLVCPIEGDR